MIIVQLSGSLGNQMFQYALGRRLSLIHQTQLKLDIGDFETSHNHFNLDRFQIRASIAEKKDVSQLINLHFLRHGDTDIDPSLFSAQTNIEENPYLVTLRDNTYLTGQCWTLKYFNAIADHLRREFKLKTAPDGVNKKYLRQIIDGHSVSIYISKDYSDQEDLRALPMDYYYRAVETIANQLKKPSFYIFSDDIAWCKENFSINYPSYYMEQNDAASAFEDLRLMKNCKHNIISNSAFSWWAAWLNPNKKKFVISPKEWFVNEKATDDFIPSRWQKIDCE